jgi:hypothetical protein
MMGKNSARAFYYQPNTIKGFSTPMHGVNLEQP